jgi:hypothetical protein
MVGEVRLDDRYAEHALEEASRRQRGPGCAGRITVLDAPEYVILRGSVEIKETLAVKERARGLVNPGDSAPPGLALLRHSIITVTVAPVLVQFLVDPRTIGIFSAALRSGCGTIRSATASSVLVSTPVKKRILGTLNRRVPTTSRV